MTTEEKQKVVMVVGAHPDDPEFGPGGTVAKWIKEGWQAVCVVCTNGDKGTSDPEMTSPKLARVREKEQAAAAKVIGYSHLEMLGYPDGGLEDTAEFRGKLVRLIRKYRPDVVMTHDPYRRFMSHRDHRITGQVTLDAIFPYCRDLLSYPEHITEGLQPHKVLEVYLFGTDKPDTIVDISDTFDQKGRGIACHISQVGDHSQDFEEWLKQRRKMWENVGKEKGIALAEGFCRFEVRR